DIKPIREVTVTDYSWYYVVGGILLLAIICFILWRYLKNRKHKEKPVFAANLSPYDEAMEELKKLKKMDLQDPAKVKTYHVLLSNIFKRYLGRKENRNLNNRTTGELLIEAKDKGLTQDQVGTLAMSLRCGDAVKFAKYVPTMIESGESMQQIIEVIQLIEQQTQTIKQ
ncbi:MAG TPA: hypothetical protein VKH37_04705, partial [Ferruginibacter sp.]|nr:hypothetical protein [Ferruginibacter sp.]